MSTLRIGGLASGIDTDSVIKQLMAAQRIPVDKLMQQKQLIEWQVDDYRTLNSKVLEFRNSAFDMKLQSNYMTKKISSSDDSIVSVSATGSANEGQYTMKIEKLAKAASITSGELAGDPGETKKLGGAGGLGLEDGNVLTIGGEKGSVQISIKPDETIGQLVADINGKSTSTGVKVTYDDTMDRLFFVSAKTGSSSKVTLGLADTSAADVGTLFNLSQTPSTIQAEKTSGSRIFESTSEVIDGDIEGTEQFQVVYDGTTYKYDITKTTTLGQLIDKINADAGKTGLSAYRSSTGELSFINPDKDKDLTFGESPANSALTKLGYTSTMTFTDKDWPQVTISGNNAIVYFNDARAEYESNTYTIGGMTFTAKKEDTGTTVNIGVTQDVDAVVDKIKKFVDTYNSLIDEVNKKISEKKNRDYQPLTDEQREAMSDDQIKKWEEVAKSGLLSNDALLSNGLYSFRTALSASVGGLPAGQLNSLAAIGISNTNISGASITGSYQDQGKLYIDETKLRDAITESPDEVMALFNTDGSSSSNDGIATRLYDQASAVFSQILDKAGDQTSVISNYSLGNDEQDIDKRISDLNVRLQDIEDRYYKQFTAMETYINQMNSQSNWLYQQFNTGG